MNTKSRLVLAALAPVLALAAAVPASAHRMWLLPSKTVLSGDDAWITVDAAVSNDLFEANHRPLDPEQVEVEMPDGSKGAIANPMRGELRGTFDVHLTSQGTYRIGMERAGILGGYVLNGERQRLPRGAAAADIAKLIPAGATDVNLAETIMRNEVFVTLGTPTEAVFKPSGKGLEMVPVTHPDDLVANEPGVFRFLIDGEPAAGLKLTVIKGGGRWLDTPIEIAATTDAKGEATIAWQDAGFYWLEAEAEDDKASLPDAGKRRMGYVTTLEVLAP